LKNPDVKYTLDNLSAQINAKRENVDRNSDGTVHSFKDASNKHNTGYPRGTIDYCPAKQVITIPVGQHLEISKKIENTPFTMAIVINMYSFKPTQHYNFLIGGHCGTLEILFTGNHLVLQTACRQGQIWYNMENMKGDSINIYIIKMDSNKNITLSINSKICINNQRLQNHYNWESNTIMIGQGINSNWKSQNQMDFYELMYFDEFYSLEKQQYVEGYLAKKWGLNVLPDTHPYKKM
jgi:hypothetical protein